jgi:CubicO group peptidase (beta-lactamase class C family)
MRNWTIRGVSTLALMVVLGGAVWAESPAVRPEAVGVSSERLRRLGAVLREDVEKGRLAGTVSIIMRSGRIVLLEAVGDADREANRPMRTDSIFRLASMTKAVTSVAAMMLVEEGSLTLDDPVSKWIPSFRETTVAVPPPPAAVAGSPVSVVKAKRSITIRDLLTHTSGLSYGEGKAEALYKSAGVHGWYCADRAEPMSALVDRMAALPFDAQPGEEFVYGFSTDVLGVVVEKASGLSLDAFFRDRIFTPLGMPDSSFFLAAEKRDRLATVYKTRDDGRVERAPEAGMDGQGAYVDGPRQCFSGGAGLLSTARDYARLLQMLLGGGAVDGVRLLSPKTVELMTTNHVGALFSSGNAGFGLGFEVIEHLGRAGRYGSPGQFSWGGAYSTDYFVDPQEKLVAVFLTQLRPWSGPELHPRFRALVYQSIVGPAPATLPGSAVRP